VLLGEDLGKVARGAASRERGLSISVPCELIARALFLFLLSSGKRVRNLRTERQKAREIVETGARESFFQRSRAPTRAWLQGEVRKKPSTWVER
jgi:hypothetical protein